MGAPEQPPAVGVMVYTAVPEAAPVVVRTSEIIEPELFVPPVTPVCATVQLKVVPVTLLVNTIKGAVPEHTIFAEGMAVAIGIAFTVSVTVNGSPVQPPAVGVITYTAVPGVVPVVTNN